MKYALVVLTILLAALGWLRPEPTPTGLVVAALALLFVAGALQLRIARQERKTAATGKFSGLLKGKQRLLLAFKKGRHPQLELGDSGAILRYGGPQGQPIFKIFDDTHLTVELERNRVQVSTLIRNISGTVVAELIRNEWKVNQNTAFDRNYSEEALEVRDASGDVVLQIRVKEDRVQFAGKFYDRNGNGVALGKVVDKAGNTGGGIEFTGSAHRELQMKIEPLFRYPSERHLGEYV
ncbi:MAG: hypothetical protein IH965_10905, partial [Gemmatimonadetes bacterium]|nr:hypothetical protein [Gemmatimonadota bacterium]